MSRTNTLFSHCHKIIEQANEELHWGLTTKVCKEYASAISELVEETFTDQQIRLVALYYHEDHKIIHALINKEYSNHDEAWAHVLKEIIDVTRKAKIAWSSDLAVEIDDIVQIANMAVSTSIQSFRYQSSFITWLSHVVVRRIQRHIRDSLTQKRAVRPERLEGVEATLPETQHPEVTVAARILVHEVANVLQGHSDARLRQLFLLSAYKDLSTEAIGKIVQLHPSRVRALLGEARLYLQQHPNIRTWRDDQPE